MSVSLFDSVIADPPSFDAVYPATMESVCIPSGGETMFGIHYLAQGQGPHPTVVLLHGYPGNEWNIDLAQAILRAGWNVLLFRYRGAWGSEGHFSFSHALEDCQAALSYLRSDTVAADYRVDTTRIVLIGHSVGGFAALVTAAQDSGIPAVASIAGVNLGLFGEMAIHPEDRAYVETVLPKQSVPLRRATGEELVEELIEHRDQWQLLNYVDRLASKSILLVCGTRDQEAIPAQHHFPLRDQLKREDARQMAEIILDSDHAFSDRRIALAREVIAWLNALPHSYTLSNEGAVFRFDRFGQPHHPE